MDTCGFPKDSYYFYQSIWTQKPDARTWPRTGTGRERKASSFPSPASPIAIPSSSSSTARASVPRATRFRGRAWLSATATTRRARKAPGTPGKRRQICISPGTFPTPRALSPRRATKDGAVVQTIELHTTERACGKLALVADRAKHPPHTGRRSPHYRPDPRRRKSHGANRERSDHLRASRRRPHPRPRQRPTRQPRKLSKATHEKAFNGLALAILQSTGSDRLNDSISLRPIALPPAQIKIDAS